MRYSLLEMVQRILDSMDSDEVNSIADTTESLTVAKIIKECYFEILSEFDFKSTESLFHLDSSADNTKPTVMYLPASANRIDRLKYNVGTSLQDFTFREIEYAPPAQFLELLDGLDPVEIWVGTQIVTLNGEDFQFKFRNDESPRFYTSFDDRTIVFDAVDTSLETTLTSARTYAYGPVVPTFQLDDTYVPELNPRQFALLLNAAKAQAFIEVKQTANDKAEKKERRHRILAAKTLDQTDNRPAIFKRQGYGRR